jgi:hypothetical protein
MGYHIGHFAGRSDAWSVPLSLVSSTLLKGAVPRGILKILNEQMWLVRGQGIGLAERIEN